MEEETAPPQPEFDEDAARSRDLDVATHSAVDALRRMHTHRDTEQTAWDADLKEVLLAQQSHEKRHLVRVLEWMRARDPDLDIHLREILFTEPDLAPAEAAHPAEPAAPAPVAPVAPTNTPLPTPAQMRLGAGGRIRG